VLGVATGTFIQICFAIVGLSSLVLASATAFDVVKYAGAAYLIFLGLKRLSKREAPVLERRPRTLRHLYTQGVVVNTLNPKTALFIFALLPQFVEADGGHVWLQVLVLGVTLCALGLLSDGMYALLAGVVGDRLRADRFQRWVGGAVLIGLGVASAAVSRPTSSG
jgi:threonine/homoserine/homoserine lactone efflux protein